MKVHEFFQLGSMATGGASLQNDELDMVTCAVCMDIFTDPRTLPCLHTFCYSCLSTMWKTTDQASEEILWGNLNKIICPLCQEKHSVPREGISAFRQDFRIKSMIDKLNSKEGLAKEETKSDIKYCLKHPEFKLRFYCKENSCQIIVCEECLSEEHESHSVCIVSKRVEQIKDDILSETKHQCTLLEGHINNVLRAQEILATEKEASLDIVSEQRKKILMKIAAFEAKLLAENKEQEDHLTRELHKLMTVQDKVNHVQNSSVKTVYQEKEADGLLTDMKELSNSLTYWNLEVPLPDVNLKITERMELKYNSEFFGYQPPNTDALDQITDNTNEDYEYEEWTGPEVNIEPAHEAEPPQFRAAQAPDEQDTRTVLHSTWQLRESRIKCGLCLSLKSTKLFAADENAVTAYDMSSGEQLFSHHYSLGEHVDGLGMVMVGNVEHLAELDKDNCQLRFILADWQYGGFGDSNNVAHVYRTQVDTSFSLSCYKSKLAYSFWGENRVRIEYLDCSSGSPKKLSSFSTGLTNHRAICLLCSKGDDLVAVTKYKMLQESNNTMAIKVMSTSGKVKWRLSWAGLDSQAERYDLREMATDGENFYILNSQEGNILSVSKEGQVLRRIVFGLKRPFFLQIDQGGSKLVTLNDRKYIQIYSMIDTN